MEQVFTAIKDVKLTRKLQAWERSASTGDRVADLKALDSLDPPPAKKCRHEDEDDEREFKDPHGKCSCTCHRYTCGTCKKFFVKVTVTI